MRTRTIRLAATLLATAATAAAAAAPAAATTMACSFTLAAQVTPGIMLAGGSGTYSVATVDPTTTKCHVGAQQPRNSIIRSTGSFDNIACNTGEWRSRWRERASERTSVDYGADGLGIGAQPDIREMEYTIIFVAGQGVLSIETVGTAVSTAQEDSLSENGRVTVVPRAGSCASPGGVTAFTMQGEFVANWGGVP